MENGREEEKEKNNNNKRKKNIITIPSYEEVLSETSNPNPKPPPSLFTPSPSFSQAFSFIKNTEFYSAPPPPSTPHPSSFSRQTNQPQASPSTSTSSSSFSLQNRNAILVSHRQKGNPLLKHIRNVKWVFADIICDYLLGQNSCALYLSANSPSRTRNCLELHNFHIDSYPSTGQVKRLYDTSHEPFRRAVTSQPPTVSVPPVEENPVINSLDDDKRAEKVAEVENKQNKDEPSLSIKSALNAAFAKYSDKVHKKKTAAEKGIKPSVDSSKEKENKRLKGGDGNEN
ncbi:hypothetical protein IFM89_025540 [Coptis chinensis]|uniref:ERCC1-like central domain-containing protein n=1 Tax=Coptis chinensis TaxID=261450 RepID=A0A835HK13_9MAGN|nr:hypothetical protein IFM89_025540 [Coptis chinensis]